MLEHFGFSPAAGEIYTRLVTRSSAAVTELAAWTGLEPGEVADQLARLRAAGAVREIDGSPGRYAAVPPDLVGEAMIQHREDELRAARAAMRSLTATYRNAHSTDSGSLIEVIDGYPDVRAASTSLQRLAKSEVRMLSKPPYAGRITEPNQLERVKLAQGVVYRSVWDRAALEIPGLFDTIVDDMRSGEQSRVFDGVPTKLMIADDRLALVALNKLGVTSSAALLVHPSELLVSLIALFELVWRLARPIRRIPDGSAVSELTDQQRRLLELLATGMTDEAIARSLNWSGRTVQRHVRRILEVLGADTRLQAGIEAARRGWI